MNPDLYTACGLYFQARINKNDKFYINNFNHMRNLHHCCDHFEFSRYGDAYLILGHNKLNRIINALKLIKADYIKTE